MPVPDGDATNNPDGDTQAAATIVFAAALDGQAATDLYTVTPDGARLVQLTNTPGGELYPSWSPDRAHIAFVRDFQLFVVNADGSNARRIAEQTGRERSIAGNVYSTTLGPAAWSPDGTQLAYLYPRPPRIIGDIDQSYATTIHLIGADGSNDRALANDPGFTINSLAWATGDTLSFSQADDCPDCAGGGWYAVMKADGTGYRQLPSDNEDANTPSKHLDWTVDGARWVYTGGREYFFYERPATIYTSAAFGSDIVQLSPDPAWNPRWSPDASSVAYIDSAGISIVAADASNPRRILVAEGVRGLDW